MGCRWDMFPQENVRMGSVVGGGGRVAEVGAVSYNSLFNPIDADFLYKST